MQSSDAPVIALPAPYLEIANVADYSVCALDGSYVIGYVNAAWRRFARDNGGPRDREATWSIGASYLDAVPKVLRDFYHGLLKRSLVARERGSLFPLVHVYECSSPTTYRRFAMAVYPLDGPVFLLAHTPVVVRDFDAQLEAHPASDDYVNADGLIKQCSHCRRVQRPRQQPEIWDWVPAWVARSPSETSHGLCDLCLVHFYS